MKAMILAAGLGTRLGPLTSDRPKALVELAGRTLLEITVSRLRASGVTEIIINVHHFADLVIDYLRARDNFGMRIEVSREEVLLDTGGGLKQAAWFFLEDPARLDEPFVLHNVDVLSSIDLDRMVQFHGANRALATLAVQTRRSSRLLLFDDQLQLVGRCGTATPARALSTEADAAVSPMASPSESARQSTTEKNENPRSQDSPVATHSPLAFSGIHVISPRLLPLLTEQGVFPIIPAYLRLAAEGHPIRAFRADQYYWRDLGRPADLTRAAADLSGGTLAPMISIS